MEILFGFGFSLITTIAGLAMVWGKVMEKIGNLEKEVDTIKKSIWKSDGTAIYVTTAEHLRVYADLKEDMEKMREEMLSQFKEFKEELARQADRNNQAFTKISLFMGRMEEFLQNCRGRK